MTKLALRCLGALSASIIIALSGCAKQEAGQTDAPPFVRTAPIAGGHDEHLVLTGSIKARHESAVAFQIGGRILARHVEAGQTVRAGQLLFALDPRDVAAAEQAAVAQLAAAEAAMTTAERELERQRQLVAQGFVSPQTLDRMELSLRDAMSRLDAARAQATQARNARGYAEVRAVRDGVITEVMAEAGQVVAAGQSLAVLAQAGEREVEVHLPSAAAPGSGRILQPNAPDTRVTLREVAGAADPQSRTWRARYRIAGAAENWPLGTVVRLQLDGASPSGDDAVQRVPLGALDERAEGPRVWRVVEGRAEPVPVDVLALEADHARIRSPLSNGDRVIALGTHRLTPGMAVRELSP